MEKVQKVLTLSLMNLGNSEEYGGIKKMGIPKRQKQGRDRDSLSVRLQPREGSSLSEIAKWLNQMSTPEKNEKVGQALLMTYLPLARANAGVSRVEIERCYWQFEDWLSSYKFIVKDALKIEEESRQDKDIIRQIAEIIARIPVKDQKKEESESKKPKSQDSPKRTIINSRQLFARLCEQNHFDDENLL